MKTTNLLSMRIGIDNKFTIYQRTPEWCLRIFKMREKQAVLLVIRVMTVDLFGGHTIWIIYISQHRKDRTYEIYCLFAS